ncbi:unnamed protein product [Sphagnum compactum]
MGKKQKRKRTVGLSTSSPRTGSPIAAIKGVEQVFTLDGETGEHVDDENDVGSGAVSMEEPGLIGCKHLESGLNLEKLGTQLARGGLVSRCHECSQVLSLNRRDKEGSSKVVKRKGTCPSAADGTGGQKLWICLVCGVINCGSSLSFSEKSQQSGDGEEIVKMEAVTMPCTGLSHAKQHSLDREPSHPLAMEWGEDLACWCFVCEVKVDYSFSSALNSASKGEDAPSSKLESLQQAAKLVQDKLAQEANNVDAAATNDDQGSESKVDEPAEVSSSNSIEAEVKPVKERRIIKGLMNLGNTCFFNSVMQNLLGVDMLWEHFSVEGSVQEGPLTTALRKFFQEIDPKSDESFDFRIHDAGLSSSFRRTTRARLFSSSIGNTYTPRDLFGAISMKAPRFKGFQQQDSHELLRCLLDGLHTEEETLGTSKLQGKKGEDREGESVKKKHETFVEKIFGGQLSSTVRCCLCGHSSVVYEPFLDLSLPMPSKQPNKKAVVHKDQAQVSSGQQSERLHTLGKGSKGLEPLDQPKTPTMSAVANSWGSGDTDQASQSITQGVICLPYYPSFRNGSSSYGQDDGDDVSSLKPENLVFYGPNPCPTSEAADNWNRSGLKEEDEGEEDGSFPMSLEGCLLAFTKSELLSGENAWGCENCSRQLHERQEEASSLKSSNNLDLESRRQDAMSGTQLQGMQDSEIGPLSLHSHMTGADAAGYILCSGDRRSKVDDTVESAVGHKSLQLNQMQQTVCYGDSYSGVQMGLASTNKLESRKNALAGDLSSLHDGHAKSLKADRMKSQKVEEPPKVMVKRDAEKRFLISKAPPILTVHLKRFAQDMRGQLSKLSGHVTFHEWLDISPFMDQRSSDKGVYRYRLIGIVEHSGTMRGGHYVAYVRGPVSGENGSEDVGPGSHTWFYISDSHVRQTSLESVLQSEAYLLFYEKCRIKDADCASF